MARTGAPKIRQGSHRVVALCLPGTVAFDLTAPAQAFRLAHGPDYTPHYGFSTCSVDGAPVSTTTGFEIGVESGLGALRRADTVVVPGYWAIDEPPPAAATAALRAAARRGARVMSVCTGAFALAAAGVLDGRRATTHWAWARDLAASFPAVEVDPDVLFVDEGEVLTSAGLSAGIDLSLHVVRRDHGAACADRVARQMVAAHTKTTNTLKGIIAGNNIQVTPPAHVDDRRQGMLDNLRGASAAEFDHRYITQQVAAHKEADILFRGYAKDGDNAAIKDFAATTDKTIKMHLSMAQKLAAADRTSH